MVPVRATAAEPCGQAWADRVRQEQLGMLEWKAVGRVRGLDVVEGILLKDGRVCLPLASSILAEVYEAAHGSTMAGHRSYPATVARMLETVFAVGLSEWVRRRVSQCETCCRAKADTRRHHPMRAIYTVPAPFHTLHIDAMLGLPASHGFDKLWLAVDRFTHFVFLVPAKMTDDAQTTAQRLLDGVFARVGLPVEIISDQDPLFTSEFSRGLARCMRISHVFSTPYRKQADGLAERQMRTLREYLRAF